MNEEQEAIKEGYRQRYALLEEYRRRRAVIYSKYPKEQERPKSIQDELDAIFEIVCDLRTSNRQVWGADKASDGVMIDRFVMQVYEDAIAKLSRAKKQNEQYISKEYEENYEFPEMHDFTAIEAQISEIKTVDDCHQVQSLIEKVKDEEFWSKETLSKLNELYKKVESIMIEIHRQEEQSKNEPSSEETLTPVSQSKIAEIYGKAKGRIRQVFAKLFGSREQDNGNREK